MGKWVEKANPEVHERVERLLVSHADFRELVGSDVKVEVQVQGGAPLKVHGCEAAAKIKVVRVEDRLAGCGDARITLAYGCWIGLNDRQRDALLVHELLHLELERNKKTGEVVCDDAGRPKLRLRPDDWSLNGFRRVVELYGVDSLEYREHLKASERLVRLLLQDGSSSSSASATNELVHAAESLNDAAHVAERRKDADLRRRADALLAEFDAPEAGRDAATTEVVLTPKAFDAIHRVAEKLDVLGRLGATEAMTPDDADARFADSLREASLEPPYA